MRVSKKETTKPTGKKTRYSITELTAAEFDAICRALGLLKEEPEQQEAAKLWEALSSIADGAERPELPKLDNLKRADLERLKRVIDD